MGGEGNEQIGVGQDCFSFDVEKSMAERKMRFFDHIVRKIPHGKRHIQGKMGL